MVISLKMSRTGPLQPFLVSSCNPPPHKLKTAMTETKRTLKIQDFTGKFLKIYDLDCKPFIWFSYCAITTNPRGARCWV